MGQMMKSLLAIQEGMKVNMDSSQKKIKAI
jgi:hypothetical protein